MDDPFLSNIEAAKDGIERAAATVETLTSPDDVAVALVELADVKRRAARAYDEAERRYLILAPEKRYEVPGVGLVEVSKRTKRTGWRHAELLPVLVARALDERQLDEESGEYEREASAVARVLRECVSFGAGKVTGLRARGIQPDEFCDETPDGYSVRLPPVQEPALSDETEAA